MTDPNARAHAIGDKNAVSAEVEPVLMVLQNEQFYAQFLEQTLKSLGFLVGGTFWKIRDALGWLEVCTPDVALIDIEVQDGDCREIADVLFQRSVPFVVYSTMTFNSRRGDLVLRRGVFLAKPSGAERILGAVQEALRRRQ